MAVSHEPLLGDNAGRMSNLGSRLGVRRVLVVVLILLGGLLLSLLLPTNKTLPCPYCKISSFIGWLYFLAWSIRWASAYRRCTSADSHASVTAQPTTRSFPCKHSGAAVDVHRKNIVVSKRRKVTIQHKPLSCTCAAASGPRFTATTGARVLRVSALTSQVCRSTVVGLACHVAVAACIAVDSTSKLASGCYHAW